MTDLDSDVPVSVVMVPVDRLRAIACPLARDPWGIGRFSKEDVLRMGDLRGKSALTRREVHLAMIWEMLDTPGHEFPPIEVDIGVPGLPGWHPGYWPIIDGNHRFSAAIIRGDQYIAADVSGSVVSAKKFLGVDI